MNTKSWEEQLELVEQECIDFPLYSCRSTMNQVASEAATLLWRQGFYIFSWCTGINAIGPACANHEAWPRSNSSSIVIGKKYMRKNSILKNEPHDAQCQLAWKTRKRLCQQAGVIPMASCRHRSQQHTIERLCMCMYVFLFLLFPLRYPTASVSPRCGNLWYWVWCV